MTHELTDLGLDAVDAFLSTKEVILPTCSQAETMHYFAPNNWVSFQADVDPDADFFIVDLAAYTPQGAGGATIKVEVDDLYSTVNLGFSCEWVSDWFTELKTKGVLVHADGVLDVLVTNSQYSAHAYFGGIRIHSCYVDGD